MNVHPILKAVNLKHLKIAKLRDSNFVVRKFEVETKLKIPSQNKLLLKTVRLRLHDVQELLQERNLKIIVLHRDPRGVMNSRLRINWCSKFESYQRYFRLKLEPYKQFFQYILITLLRKEYFYLADKQTIRSSVFGPSLFQKKKYNK